MTPYEEIVDKLRSLLVGEDIDGICCKMAAVNLAVHGCFGEVIRHDSIGEQNALRYGYIVNETLAGICSEDRSMISPDYARNFICDFVIGQSNEHTLPTLF